MKPIRHTLLAVALAAAFPALAQSNADILKEPQQAVIVAIAEARAHGDISENAEYDAAREKQGFIEGRILELEAKLANAQVIDPALLEDDGRVVFGTTVELVDTAGSETMTYQIVGEDEADIKGGKISYSSRSPRPSSGSSRATSPRFGRRAG